MSTPRSPRWESFAPPMVSLLVTLAVASSLILLYGQSPSDVYLRFLRGTWGNPYGVGQVLYKATPLVFTGLAVAVAFRAGLFNVGAEGQLALGAFAAAIVGAHLPASTPGWIALPLCLAAACVAGAAAGSVPGVLKALRGSHEVIVTIMLNFVILAKLSDWGQPYFLRESVHTAPIVTGAELPRLSEWFPSLRGSAANGALGIAVASVFAVWWGLARTQVGFRLRAIGINRDTAATYGISIARQTILAMALSGAIAALVGANFVLGYKRYYEEGFSGGVGFMGIAVALLGRNHPLGILVAALFFGTLSQGGLAINAIVPKELIDILQAVVILAIAAASAASLRAERVR